MNSLLIKSLKGELAGRKTTPPPDHLNRKGNVLPTFGRPWLNSGYLII
jgi:hypothetical protein